MRDGGSRLRRWTARATAVGVVLGMAAAASAQQGRGIDVQPLVQVTSFLIGTELNAADYQRILADVAQRQATDPAGLAQEMATLRQVMEQVTAASAANPVARALLRDQLYTAFYLQSAQAPTEEVPEALHIVFERVPVVAANPAAGLVVDARDVDAFFAMDRFVAQLAGIPPSFGEAARPAFEQYARQLVASGDPTAAQLAQFSVTWEQVRLAWSQLPPATQQAVVAAMRTQIQQAAAAGQLPPEVPWDLRNGPLSMEEFGAVLSRNHLFNNIFLQNLNAMAN